MQEIYYPRKGLKLSDVYTQETLDKLLSLLDIWMQGPGMVGGLQVHSCWGKTSVLDKGYQGETISQYDDLLQSVMKLYEKTGNLKWKCMADNFVSNILFLQEPDGGFRHASAEFEPTFTSILSCPIHQCKPILALLKYVSWEHAAPTLLQMIRPAIDRHWEWFQKTFWRIGNGGHRPFPYEAGWCGVTNQDLVVIAALSEYGKVYGDWSRFEAYGKPALDVYLSDVYYYKEIGLFERGDGNNFAERTSYYVVILSMLQCIFDNTKDGRLPDVIDNVISHLFDAAYVAPDGMTHLAWGAVTDPHDKSRVVDWIKTPVVFSGYPVLIKNMQQYLERHPNAKKQEILDAVTEAFCGYIFSDGTIPPALWPKNPVLSIVSILRHDAYISCIIEYLGDSLQDSKPVDEICIHRKLGNFTWKQRGKLWEIDQDDVRVYGGYTPYPAGITQGPDAPALCGNYDDLQDCDILEIIDHERITE